MDPANVKIKECPYCEGVEFGEGRQMGYAKLVTGTFNLGGQYRLYELWKDSP